MDNVTSGSQSSEYRLIKVLLLVLSIIVVGAVAAVAIFAPESLAKVMELGLQVIAGVFTLLGGGYALSRGIAKRPPVAIFLPLALSTLLLASCTAAQQQAWMDWGLQVALRLGPVAGKIACQKVKDPDLKTFCLDGVAVVGATPSPISGSTPDSSSSTTPAPKP